jgi:hypothetical protein
MPDLKHEFEICPHILTQVIVRNIHKVAKFGPQDVVEILWNKFGLEALLKEFPSVAMVLPFLLSHCSPPCGGITLQVGLGKLQGRTLPNLGSMYVIFHFCKPSIHNL